MTLTEKKKNMYIYSDYELLETPQSVHLHVSSVNIG